MVLAEFYESFVLSKKGQLEHEEKDETRYSKASTIFKNIKSQIDDARKLLRNKKVLMFRKSSFLPNPLVFQAMDFENEFMPFKSRFIFVMKDLIHNKFIKKVFSLCAFFNILLILYDIIFEANNEILNIIDTVFSLVLALEFLSAIFFYGPLNYLKKTSYQKLDLFIIILIFLNLGLHVSEGVFASFCHKGPLGPFLESLKIMRIFKLMQKSKLFFFRAISKLLREILNTIIGLWDFVVIIIVTMIVCAFIGIEILRTDDLNLSSL